MIRICLFGLLVVLFASQGCGQNAEYIAYDWKGLKWKQHEAKITTPEKLKLIQLVKESPDFDSSAIRHYLYDGDEQFHALDFNKDGKVDIVFNSKLESYEEHKVAAFFVNDGDSVMRLAVKLNGILVALNQADRVSFVLRQSGCCANRNQYITQWIFSDSATCYEPRKDSRKVFNQVNESFCCVRKLESYSFFGKTVFPSNSHPTDTLITQNEFILTLEPLARTCNVDQGWFDEKIGRVPVGTTLVLLSGPKRLNGQKNYFIKILDLKEGVDTDVMGTGSCGWMNIDCANCIKPDAE